MKISCVLLYTHFGGACGERPDAIRIYPQITQISADSSLFESAEICG